LPLDGPNFDQPGGLGEGRVGGALTGGAEPPDDARFGVEGGARCGAPDDAGDGGARFGAPGDGAGRDGAARPLPPGDAGGGRRGGARFGAARGGGRFGGARFGLLPAAPGVGAGRPGGERPGLLGGRRDGVAGDAPPPREPATRGGGISGFFRSPDNIGGGMPSVEAKNAALPTTQV